MKIGLKCGIGLAIFLVAVEALDLCSGAFNHSWYPGEAVLAIMGAFAVVYLTIAALLFLFLPPSRKDVVVEPVEEEKHV